MYGKYKFDLLRLKIRCWFNELDKEPGCIQRKKYVC